MAFNNNKTDRSNSVLDFYQTTNIWNQSGQDNLWPVPVTSSFDQMPTHVSADRRFGEGGTTLSLLWLECVDGAAPSRETLALASLTQSSSAFINVSQVALRSNVASSSF